VAVKEVKASGTQEVMLEEESILYETPLITDLAAELSQR